MGRALSTTDALGLVTSYTYDALGNPLTRTDPGGRLTSFKYTPTGLLEQVLRADGSATTYEYDPVGRPTEISGPEGTNYYFYDAAGRVTAAIDVLGRPVTREVSNGLTTRYRWTDAGQLAQTATYGSGGHLIQGWGYEYDAAGNTAL